jgi:hypothetical protein
MSNDADSDITLTRSPRSPSETLKDAIDRAEKLLAGLGRGAGPVEAVAKAIGFGGLSGASRSSLASLTSYGFLTKQGNNYRISDLALRILRPLNPADRIAAIAEAQSSPKLFAEIQQDHPEASEDVLANLLLHKGFTEDRAKRAAYVFKDNVEFLKNSGYVASQNQAASVAKTTQAETKSNTTSVSQSPAISANELPVPIGEGRVARVPFPMSEEDFDLFIGTLNLWKKKLTAKPTKPIETMDVD